MNIYVKKNTISMLTASILCIFSTNISALTLKESVSEILKTNPVIQERLSNFREVQQDLNIAQSEFLPTLDYTGSFNLNNAGEIKDNVVDESYNNYTHSLRLTQNLFSGFSTLNNIDSQKARILAAAYHYVENANDVAFSLVQAYINVIRGYQLFQNAQENVAVNESIYLDVKSLFDTGLTTKSEMTKIFASLSLAKSNLVVQENNTKENEFRFKRLFGREVNVSTLSMPALNLAMPESLERATLHAIEYNPSIIVSNYNIKGSQALYKQKKGNFYPRVDLSVEQFYNDVSKTNAFNSPDDRLIASVNLSWNLFRGGADAADLQKSRSAINKEVELLRDLKRQTIEGIELSWSSYTTIGDQLKELYQYKVYSQDTLESYKSEYELGRRTLLDLLGAQNDLNNSNVEIINAQLDKLFAQYRILDSMGLLVDVIIGDSVEYNKIIEPTLRPFNIVKDSLPVNLDVDKDGIVDNLDICDNSLSNDDIKAYGCAQREIDSDFDGIFDTKDNCPTSAFGDIVDENGCKIEDSENKFKVNQDMYLQSVVAYNENSPIKSEKLGLYDYEFSTNPDNNVKSTELDNHLMYDNFKLIKRFIAINMNGFNAQNSNEHLDAIVNEIKKYETQDISVTIIGNTRTNINKEESYQEALAYATTIEKLLISKGVKAEVLAVQSRVDYDKLYLETTRGDKKLNDRVDVSLYVPTAKDDDKDGVINELDKCPDTPIGYVVDENGCPLDDDKDGVVNELDECPDTPEGYIVDSTGCTKKIDLNVLFERDSAVIEEQTLDTVNLFKKYLDDFPEYDVIITGHASKNKNSSDSYNLKLTSDRANNVKEYLISEGIDEKRLNAIGKGYREPIASNETKEGRAQNRRIKAELVLRTVVE